MAINWDTTKIKDELAWYKLSKEQIKKEQTEKTRTYIIGKVREKRGSDVYEMVTELNLLILLTINVGFNEITEDNYKKFFKRLDLMQTLSGSFLRTDKIDSKGNRTSFDNLYTLDMVKRFVGLKTNATPLTTNQFMKTISKQHLETY